MSPRLATSIPGASLDINRGSLLYPLYKRNGIIMTDRDSGFGIDNDHLEKVKTGRSFPLVTPSTSKSTQSDNNPALRLEPESAPVQPQHHHGVRGSDDDQAYTDLQRPPSIRVISVEAEKESQKVRSLYETAEDLSGEDGDRRASLIDVRLEPPEEVPSDEDENDAYGFLEHIHTIIFTLSVTNMNLFSLIGKTTPNLVRLLLKTELLLRRHTLIFRESL